MHESDELLYRNKKGVCPGTTALCGRGTVGCKVGEADAYRILSSRGAGQKHRQSGFQVLRLALGLSSTGSLVRPGREEAPKEVWAKNLKHLMKGQQNFPSVERYPPYRPRKFDYMMMMHVNLKHSNGDSLA